MALEAAVARVNAALVRGWRPAASSAVLAAPLPPVSPLGWSASAEIVHALSPVPLHRPAEAEHLLDSYEPSSLKNVQGPRRQHREYVSHTLLDARLPVPATRLAKEAAHAAQEGDATSAARWIEQLLTQLQAAPVDLPAADVQLLRQVLVQCVAAAGRRCGPDEAITAAGVCLQLAAKTGGRLSRTELLALLDLVGSGRNSLSSRRMTAWKGLVPATRGGTPTWQGTAAPRVAAMQQLLFHGRAQGVISDADAPVAYSRAAAHCIACGAVAGAVAILNSSAPSPAGRTAVLNKLIEHEAGARTPSTGAYLRLMQQGGLQPNPATLHALLKVYLHSGGRSNGAGVAAFMQSMAAALGLEPSERSLGYAAFHAAKHGHWPEVQRIRTLARTVRRRRGQEPAKPRRWEVKLAVLGRTGLAKVAQPHSQTARHAGVLPGAGANKTTQ